jgi:hypothetical protein
MLGDGVASCARTSSAWGGTSQPPGSAEALVTIAMLDSRSRRFGAVHLARKHGHRLRRGSTYLLIDEPGTGTSTGCEHLATSDAGDVRMLTSAHSEDGRMAARGRRLPTAMSHFHQFWGWSEIYGE